MYNQYGMTTSARQRWTELTGERSAFFDRCQEYARLTVSRLLTPDGYNQNNDELNRGWTSFPAQAVLNLAAKLSMVLFPESPFFRLEPSDSLLAELGKVGMDESQVREILSLGEQKAMMALKKDNSLRSKLNGINENVIVTGNALLHFGPETLRDKKRQVRYFGLDRFCVKRSADGEVIELLIREPTTVHQLLPEVKAILPGSRNYQEKVCIYSWICRDEKGWTQTTYVEDTKLPEKFGGKWPEGKMPWHVITWSLADGADYGTGLVEDCATDIVRLHDISRALTEGIQLAVEHRWICNPAGQTSIEDLERSVNGDVIPGMNGDIQILQAGSVNVIEVARMAEADLTARIGRSFLMTSGGVRDAERVTAEEIRMYAQELETSLGGAYTRLAEDFQAPLARWLLEIAQVKVSGKDIEPVVITGLDALSRNGDADKIKLWLQDMAQFASLPPALQQVLRPDAIAAEFAAARGVQKSKFMLTQEQINQLQEAQRQQALAQAQMPPEAGAPSGQPAPMPPAQ